MLVRATWNEAILAESNQCIVVEGNYYFPAETLVKKHFQSSNWRSHCHWKGTAFYFHIEVDGSLNKNAAWYYPDPLPAATNIKGYVKWPHLSGQSV